MPTSSFVLVLFGLLDQQVKLALMNKVSTTLELSWKFIKSALLVGHL